ncbi:MAG TPA: DUF402 domain-containing protein [Tepidiformaceae bacterium]|nr:DUF402 domain-containing protein [Tepidiformaceae bacterium]
MQHSHHWQPGDCVTLRYLTRDGRPGMAWPFTVVRDTEDLVALFIPAGSVYKRWGADANGQRALVDAAWRDDVLRLMFPGHGYSIWLFWRVIEGTRRLAYYYVNMEEPFRRSEIGFDTNDHMLDIVVEPDLSAWRWKDADEFDARVTSGIYGSEFAAALRAEAEGVVACIQQQGSPFCDGWPAWLPDTSWPAPVLSERWDIATPVTWPRAAWAYLDTTR